MPSVFAPVVDKGQAKDSTYYQVLVGPGALFEGMEGTRYPAIRDGAAFTMMVVEASTPVPWTKPEDIPYDPEKPLPELGGLFEDGFHFVFADGSAFFLSRKIDSKIVRALITRNGGEALNFRSTTTLIAYADRCSARSATADPSKSF